MTIPDLLFAHFLFFVCHGLELVLENFYPFSGKLIIILFKIKLFDNNYKHI